MSSQYGKSQGVRDLICPKPEGSRGAMLRTFIFATLSLVCIFATAGSPIPLYNIYKSEDGLTNAHLGMVSVGYFLAAAISLLFLGRLSNHLGRRPVCIAALVTAGASCIVLAASHGAVALLIARVLQGLACGLGSTALGAYVVDTAPQKPAWLKAVITGSAPMIGLPIGAFACGALAEYGPMPRILVFVIIASVLSVCTLLIFSSPETMVRSRGIRRSLRPRLQVPAGFGRLLFAAGCSFVATWSIGGFYQAFGSSVTADYLGTNSAVTAAATFACVMILNPLGAPLVGRLSPSWGMRVGMAVFVLALAGIIVSLRVGLVIPFMLASLFIGLAQGMASTAAIRALLQSAAVEERAGLLASIYLISYTGVALPAIVAGQLADRFDLFQIAAGYVTLGVIASLATVLALATSDFKAPEKKAAC